MTAKGNWSSGRAVIIVSPQTICKVLDYHNVSQHTHTHTDNVQGVRYTGLLPVTLLHSDRLMWKWPKRRCSSDWWYWCHCGHYHPTFPWSAFVSTLPSAQWGSPTQASCADKACPRLTLSDTPMSQTGFDVEAGGQGVCTSARCAGPTWRSPWKQVITSQPPVIMIIPGPQLLK